MLDTKTWWQSRTIWLQIVSALFAILAAFHILPVGLDQEQVVGAIMGAVAILTLILRLRSTHAIGGAVVPTAAKKAGSTLAAIGVSLALPLLMLTNLSACATPGAGSSSIARLARITADFEQARAFAAPFLNFLPPAQAGLVHAAAELVEKALAAARSATSLAEREEALRTAERGTADYRFVTGG